MMAELFSPERLRLARQRRRLQVQELAALVGVTSRSVSAWENAKKVPTEENVGAMAAALVYPRGFFFRPAPPALTDATFRALAKMTAGQRDAATAAGVQAVEFDEYIGTLFRRPEPNLPDMRELDPEGAAESLRAVWGLANRPVPNLVHLLEKNGVRVYSLVHDGVEVDAFSGWSQNKPFVFLNTMKTAERSRMDAAHELGHLMLHHHSGAKSKKQEDEAKEFASAFLMPRRAFLASAPRRSVLPAIVDAKWEWGVSTAAYAYRLHALGRIPYWEYRSLCIRLRSQYGSSEPGRTLRRESSQVLAKVLGTKESGGVSRYDVAESLCIPLSDLDEMTFGLALTSVQGGGMQSAPGPRPEMKLLK